MNVWHRDNFNQWSVGTVKVDKTVSIEMCELASIPLEMGVFNANLRAIRKLNKTWTNNWLVHLGNLITFRRIWIKIMLAIEA